MLMTFFPAGQVHAVIQAFAGFRQRILQPDVRIEEVDRVVDTAYDSSRSGVMPFPSASMERAIPPFTPPLHDIDGQACLDPCFGKYAFVDQERRRRSFTFCTIGGTFVSHTTLSGFIVGFSFRLTAEFGWNPQFGGRVALGLLWC